MSTAESHPAKKTENEVIVSGKWGSEIDDFSEQIHAEEFIQEKFDFETGFSYDPAEFSRSSSRLKIATVRGFWLEESEDSKLPSFVVLMELEDNQLITVNFTVEEGSYRSIHNRRLEEFLKSFGVNSDSCGDILGRKIFYEQKSEKFGETSVNSAFYFYNTNKTRLSILSQKIGGGIVALSCISLFLSVGRGDLPIFISLSLMMLGTLVIGIDVIRRTSDNHCVVDINEYMVEKS